MRNLVFGIVAIAATVTLSACGSATPTAADMPAAALPAPAATTAAPKAPSAPAAPAKKVTQKVTTTAAPATKKATTSDLSQLKRAGIDLGKGVLIDVADDGQDRFLQIGANGVDFTGTSKVDSTMMALRAAPVSQRNRVVIVPPFWNEDLGGGYCVEDTKGAALRLAECTNGRPAQIWEIRPAGDSGQFELHGIHGVVRVDKGKITTGGTGRTGLQTIPFAP